MRSILITTGIFSPESGGPASFAHTLAGRLSADAAVTVLTYSSVFHDRRDGTLPFRIVRVWKKNLKFLRHLVFLLRTLSLVRRADAILALNAVSAGVPTALAARFARKPFAVRIVGDYAWETAVNSGATHLLINDFQRAPRRGKSKLLHRFQVWTARKAQTVIVPSEYLADIVRGWGIEPEKIRVVYNGVDFKPVVMPHDQARRQIGISGNIILSVGRLVPWKGFRMLVKIMPQLLQINQFFRLVIVGDGPDEKLLKTMVKNLGLERKVYLVGRKNHQELALYMAAAEMFVLNTGYEGFSHLILEAMEAGVPVITTAVGGNREIINQGENGFMVKYNDEFNLTEAIKTLWTMPELREKFVQQGRKAVSFFNVDKMYNETMEVLSSLPPWQSS